MVHANERWAPGQRAPLGAPWVIALAAAGLLVACGRSALRGLGGQTGEGLGGIGGVAPGGGGPGGFGAGGFGAGGAGAGGSGAGGGGGACEVASQCVDSDPCTTDRCEGGLCVHPVRDDDQDSFGPIECGGPDCNDLNPNTYPGHAEVCTDADDNDCNGVADCFDPACFTAPVCGCVPSPGGEDCANGEDDDCDTTVDCNDADCLGTPECGCLPSEIGLCSNGFDDDCDAQFDCDDSDCWDDPSCGCLPMLELCDNGVDEDCDFLVDCADPECAGWYPCACVPPGTPEACSNGLDDDCDKLLDCADPDCLASTACQQCTAEVCNDGLDNNCNDKIDCADPECYFNPACPIAPEICNNELDDDHDELIDCADPDCANNPWCVLQQSNCLSPRLITGTGSYTGDTSGNIGDNAGSCGGGAGEAVFYFVLTEPSRVHLDSVGTSFDSTLYVRQGSCLYGTELGCDDDTGGNWAALLDFTILYPGIYYVFLDGYTIDPYGGPNEGPFQLNVEIEPNPPELCADGIDNDGDHYVDCADSSCVNAAGCYLCNGGLPPGPELGVEACVDGRDNDCDGDADCSDEDCSASDYYVTECCDGTDENGNGIIDDFNCACVTDADCELGEICYTHTAWTCGYPCDQFFGQICPYVAPGSYCNLSTLQCEF